MSAVEDHVRSLDQALVGPRRLKRDMLREVRHGLSDTAEAYAADGLHDPEQRAVAEFGAVGRVAPGYQRELAAAASRTFGLLVAAIFTLLTVTADFMWRGAPWTGPRPPDLYLFLSNTVDRLSVAAAALAGVGVLALWVSSRTGRPVPRWAMRITAVTVVVLTGFVWLFGTAVFVWSTTMWEQALTWPPMIIGAALLTLVGVGVGRSAWTCLAATRAPAAA